jgi:hypothetical protein
LGTLDSTLKPQSTITATDTIDNTVSGTASVKATPPAGTHIVVSAPASTLINTQFSVTLTVVDPFNNVLLGYNGTVHFSSNVMAMATLPPNYTFTVGSGGDNGVHTFNNVILHTAGSDTVTATDTATSTITGTTTVSALSTLASALSVTGFPSPTTAGGAHSFTVTARDSFGNRVRGFLGTVQFTSSDAHAALPLRYTFTSADQGMHVFSASFVTGGRQWLAATWSTNPSIGGRQSGIIVSAGPIAALSNPSPSIDAPSSYSPDIKAPSATAAANGLAAGGRPWDMEVANGGADSSLASHGLNLRHGGNTSSFRKAIADLMTTAVDELFANTQ